MPKQHDTAQLARWQIQPVTHVVFTSVLMEHVGLDQRSYSTLGPVSAWVGDRLRTGKLPRRRTRHPGLLSPSQPFVAGWNEYPAKAGGVNRHIVWYTSPYSRPHSVVLVPDYIDWLEKINADLWGSSSMLATMCHTKPLLQYFTFLLGYRHLDNKSCVWQDVCEKVT